MNYLRFHSYCPPDAAFRVADKMGFYLQASRLTLNVSVDGTNYHNSWHIWVYPRQTGTWLASLCDKKETTEKTSATSIYE